ncbi:MAG: prepilin peptidase [Candidatus Falkowbacteria bacterium]
MLFIIFIFGLIMGSFLNCFILRLHAKKTMLGRSFCPKCKKQIAWYDNIPVLSFLILGGRCRSCKKRISFQYIIVELATGLLFTLSFYIANIQYSISNIQLLLIFKYWFLISVMIIVFIYDLRWYLILDRIVLPSCVIIFSMNLFLGFSSQGGFPSWQNMLISGIIGGSFFLIQFLISRGKWIGGGDIRLGLLMGISLGWPDVITAIFLAYFMGSIIGLGLIAFKKKKWGSQIPLGVFLSTSTIITLFWGELIIKWYFGLF